jgi:branched-chain amino acid aminotransferase
MPRRQPVAPDTSAIISIDGRIISSRSASISVQDWGFRYGWGAFETIRLSEGCPIFLADHLARMAHTASALLISDSAESDWWRKAITRAVARARFREGSINLYWTRGAAPDFRGKRIVVIRKRSGLRARPTRLWIAPWRVEPGMPGVGAKTLGYLPYTFATLAAQASGYDEALLLNPHECIADASAASVFLIERGKLRTPLPSEGALPGITRGVILDAARHMGIAAHEGQLRLNRVWRADGVFVTSALRGITVVRSIGGRTIRATPEAKRLIARLRRAYQKAVEFDIANSPD